MTNILCAFGLHGGTWVDDPQRGPCAQRRMCTRCTAEPRRIVHDHQLPPDGRLIYVDDEDDCYVHGVCTRCGNIGGRLGPYHRWANNESRYDEEAAQIIFWQPCLHCRAYRERPAVPVEFAN